MSRNTHDRYALPKGTRVSDYRIESYMGRGGFAITYRARCQDGQNVAVKEYFPRRCAVRTPENCVIASSSGEEHEFNWGRRRFILEAEHLSRLHHRGIVRFQNIVEANGTLYLVTEYIPGATLEAVLKQFQRLDEHWLLKILVPTLDAVEAVHRHGIIHRDIKPANIIVRPDETPVLIDFGASREITGGKFTVVKTEGYAPWEQYHKFGRNGGQGPWTDVYALGATCWRCISGGIPSSAADRFRKIYDQKGPGEDPLLPAVKAGEGRYSPSLLAAIDRAMAVRPDDRFRSVAQFREAIYRRDGSSLRGVSKSGCLGIHPTATPSPSVEKSSPAYFWGRLARLLKDQSWLRRRSSLRGSTRYGGWWELTAFGRDDECVGRFEVSKRTFGTSRELLIGRQTDCDIVITEKSISRRHAKICWGDDGLVILDIGSRNGTVVNQRRIPSMTQVAIDCNSEIWLGANVRVVISEGSQGDRASSGV
jgi:serine/threonine protein kinase